MMIVGTRPKKNVPPPKKDIYITLRSLQCDVLFLGECTEVLQMPQELLDFGEVQAPNSAKLRVVAMGRFSDSTLSAQNDFIFSIDTPMIRNDPLFEVFQVYWKFGDQSQSMRASDPRWHQISLKFTDFFWNMGNLFHFANLFETTRMCTWWSWIIFVFFLHQSFNPLIQSTKTGGREKELHDETEQSQQEQSFWWWSTSCPCPGDVDQEVFGGFWRSFWGHWGGKQII